MNEVSVYKLAFDVVVGKHKLKGSFYEFRLAPVPASKIVAQQLDDEQLFQSLVQTYPEPHPVGG